MDRVLESKLIGKLLGWPSRVVVMFGPTGVLVLSQFARMGLKGGRQVSVSRPGLLGATQVSLLLKLASLRIQLIKALRTRLKLLTQLLFDGGLCVRRRHQPLETSPLSPRNVTSCLKPDCPALTLDIPAKRGSRIMKLLKPPEPFKLAGYPARRRLPSNSHGVGEPVA
eukprot:CAMPEP_0118829940 /NCGR_PEP_ID=MMETSP1162-20130426/25370_1 /TAXON_ID=33656 /ORGANISM="Phaeocystis Sp, Strain CCMP2710" /LENGTH=167 /DNA_ID=CAMNT_0006761191 /DNA_START=268 /DNA_END=771 /DNA_ORIENTATION=-